MRKVVSLAVAVVTVLTVSTIASPISAQVGQAWPTFHGTISRSGVTSSSGPVTSAISNQWQLPAAVESSPAVDGNGTAYVGDDNNSVYALSPSSSMPRWSFQTGGPVISSPTLSADGSTLFVGSEDDSVYALNTSTGAKIWSVGVGGMVHASPLLSPDGTVVFVATTTGEVWALKASDGTPVWSVKHFINLGSSVPGSLSLSADGSILYVAAVNGYMYGIVGAETSTPTVNTVFYLGVPATDTPAIDGNGNAYVGAANGTLQSFTPSSSTPRWTFGDPAHASIRSTPAFAGSQVIFGTDDQNLYSVDAATGIQNWQAHTGGAIRSSAAISGNGYIYVGSDDGTLYALTTSGALAWAKTVSSPIDSSPAIGPDGSLWVGSMAGAVYRFGQPVTPTATATATATATSNATATPTSTPTPAATATATATDTPSPTDTPAPTVVARRPANLRGFRLLDIVPLKSRRTAWPFKKGGVALRIRQKVTFAMYVRVPNVNTSLNLRFHWTLKQGRKVVASHSSLKRIGRNKAGRYVGRWTYLPKRTGRFGFQGAARLDDGLGSVTRSESFAVVVGKG